MKELARSFIDLFKAVGRVLSRDPLAVFGVFPIPQARQRLNRAIEHDRLILRLVAVSGESIEAVERAFSANPDLDEWRGMYRRLCQGEAWEHVVGAGIALSRDDLTKRSPRG